MNSCQNTTESGVNATNGSGFYLVIDCEIE
jgi:hypothetical protein